MAAAALATRERIEVLGSFEPPSLPIAVVFASKRSMPIRLRLFIDAVACRSLEQQEVKSPRPPQ
jgi:hypothetical protein